MKALTILQPYAELIARGEKRVENRTWPTNYRGPLVIHAGANRRRLGETDLWGGNRDADADLLDFGAIVAVAELFDCVRVDDCRQRRLPEDPLDWLADHPHVQGPWCWLLANVRRLAEPIPCSGKLSLWNVGHTELVAINRQLRSKWLTNGLVTGPRLTGR